MLNHTLNFRVVICLLIATIGSMAFAEDFRHSTSDSYYESGYDYYWSVIQSELDRKFFLTDEETDQYFELMDIMVRTGSQYGHTYQNISLGITQMYPRLLKLDADPPLYTQYRFLKSYFDRRISPERDMEIAHELLEVARRMGEENYPSYIEGISLLRAAYMLRSIGSGEEEVAKDARERGIKRIIEAASLDGVEPKSREYLATEISNYCRSSKTLTISEREYLCLQLFGDDAVEDWISHLSLGWLMVDKAWDARSNKRGHLVNDAQWELFYMYLSVADRHLTQAWQLKPEWPSPAVQMITVAMGGGLDPVRDEEFWFQQATTARIDEKWAYSKYRLSLAPKWGGSSEQLYALLDDVIDVSLNNDHMAYIYVNLMAEISKITADPYEVFFKDEYLAHATRMMKEEIQSKQESVSRVPFQKTLRAIAMANFMNQNYEETALLLKGGGAMVYYNFSAWKSYSRFSRYMRALASDYSDEVILALQASDQGNLEEAVLILQGVQGSMAMEPEKEYPNIMGDPVKCVHELIRHIQLHKRDN